MKEAVEMGWVCKRWMLDAFSSVLELDQAELFVQ